MNWFTQLFAPSPEPPIGSFVKGILDSVKTSPSAWARAGDGFRHIPTNMTMQAIDVGDLDDICMVTRLNPRQDLNWAEEKALVRACYELGVVIRGREEAETARQAAGVRAHFESP